MTSMTRFYAVNTYGISISRIACLTSVKVVHGKRRVTRDFVQTLPVAHRLLDGILIIKDFIPCKFKLIFFISPNEPDDFKRFLTFVSQFSTSDDGFDSAGQAQTSESIVEYLIVLEGGGRVVCYFYARGETVENTIPPQNWYALSTNQDSGLGVAKYVILFEDPCEKLNATH